MTHPPDWPGRLESIARMRRMGRSWAEIARFFGVSEKSIRHVRKKYAAHIDVLIARQSGKLVKVLPPAVAVRDAIDGASARPKGRKGPGSD